MNRKYLLFFLLLLLLSPAQVFSLRMPAKKRPWQGKDTSKIKRIRDLQVSPDNQYLLFVISEQNLHDNRSYSSLWVLPTKGGESRPLTDLKGSVFNPKWSPDGKKIAFFSSKKGKIGLWIMNSDGSIKRKLTGLEKSNAYLGKRGNELCWSPDGKKLAYNAAGPRHYTNIPSPQHPPNENEVMVVDRLLYKCFYYYSDLRRTYVWMISVDEGNPEQLSFGDYDYHSLSWSPDGLKIACVSNRTGKDDFNANNDICLLSTEGKEMIQLTHTVGPEYTSVWSSDGSKIVYLGRTRDHRSKESDAELYKIFVIPAQGGEPTHLTETLDRWSMLPTWSHDSKKVYFTAQKSGRVILYVAPLEEGRVAPVVEENGQVGSFSLGKNEEIFYVFTDFTHPEEIFRIQDDGRGKRKLTAFNKEITNEVEIVESEQFTFPSFDGLKIEGWIMKPLNFKEGKKYPMILAIHGGPHAQYGYNLNWTAKYQFLAAHGYVVIFMNPRGSSGYGQNFSDMCVGDLGGGDYKDLMAGVNYVLENYDFVDPERLGLTGVSYGGYMTNWIITHTNRFKAAVPVSSISNLISVWGTDCNTLWFESDMGFMPFENYDRAWDVSPLKYIKNCKTPTLFINGAWDFCTNLNQAEEMFTALKKLGIDAVLAIYPNEGHGVHNQPKNTFDYHQRTLAWFDKYLK